MHALDAAVQRCRHGLLPLEVGPGSQGLLAAAPEHRPVAFDGFEFAQRGQGLLQRFQFARQRGVVSGVAGLGSRQLFGEAHAFGRQAAPLRADLLQQPLQVGIVQALLTPHAVDLVAQACDGFVQRRQPGAHLLAGGVDLHQFQFRDLRLQRGQLELGAHRARQVVAAEPGETLPLPPQGGIGRGAGGHRRFELAVERLQCQPECRLLRGQAVELVTQLVDFEHAVGRHAAERGHRRHRARIGAAAGGPGSHGGQARGQQVDPARRSPLPLGQQRLAALGQRLQPLLLRLGGGKAVLPVVSAGRLRRGFRRAGGGRTGAGQQARAEALRAGRRGGQRHAQEPQRETVPVGRRPLQTRHTRRLMQCKSAIVAQRASCIVYSPGSGLPGAAGQWGRLQPRRICVGIDADQPALCARS
ncbi:MAG: hypothetical protein IPK42_11650 [Betaproteobacteria bacterium]|nr:hypothetical protein [Betaproteobacteria bacterium]